MPINLAWTNYNAGPTTIKVMRSATQITESNPGTLIATLNDVTSWEDPLPTFSDTFWYQLIFETPMGTMPSAPVQFKGETDYGLGGRKILKGNSVLGYMGTVPSANIGLDLSVYNTTVIAQSLHKFIYNGRILYSPGMMTVKAPNLLIASNAFCGGVTPAFGAANEPGGDPIYANGRKYFCRIAKVYDRANANMDLTTYGNAITSTQPVGESELIDFLNVFNGDSYPTKRSPFFVPGSVATTISSSSSSRLLSCDFQAANKLNVQSLGNPNANVNYTASTAGGQAGFSPSPIGQYAVAIPIIEYAGVVK